MIKWQYMTIENKLTEKSLNTFGAAGWELVNFTMMRDTNGFDEFNYIFKRPKVE